MTEVSEERREKARRLAIFITGGVVFAVVVSLATIAFVLKPNSTSHPAKDDDLQVVQYESPSDTGDAPFTTASDVEGDKLIKFKPAGGSTGAGGSEPFGGSGSLHVCDREKLVDFLLSHDAQRRAWAGVLRIDQDKDSVARYVRSLTPVTLTVDTRVTNHLWSHGRAVPFQSILAAGTAVLVDKYGRPVVRCKCGNPLWWPRDYPRIHCKGCPPHYHPPKPCRWRIYDPWYPYPPESLPPDWRDPYPKSYPKPKPWVYKQGKYCYIVYPDPPEIEYPPKWYPPSTYTPPPNYNPPKPRFTYRPPDNSDGTDSDSWPSDSTDSDSSGGCCGGMDSTDSDGWPAGSMN